MNEPNLARKLYTECHTQKNFHIHCPTGPDSWCGYHKDKENFKDGPGLPMDVIKHVKPMFEDLSKNSLLEKCLDGKTQNQNESFNNLIWERVPKTNFVGFVPLETAVYDAVAHFNIGNLATLKVFEFLGIEPGTYTKLGCSNLNQDRVKNAKCHTTPGFILRRRLIRGNRKRKADDHEGSEGKLYCPGIAK